MLLLTGAVAGPVLTTPTSAIVPTVVLAVDELLVELPSGFELLTVAVLSTLPLLTPAFGLRCTTSVKFALDGFGRSGIVHVTVPPEPTAGVMHVNVGPLFCCREMKVVLAGRASLSAALSASAVQPGKHAA